MFDRQGRRKYLNEAERHAFLNAAKQEPDKSRRDFGLTLHYTGCRISEALKLTAGRIDSADKRFVFETLKQRQRGVFRGVPVPDSLSASCMQSIISKDPSARLWTFSRTTAYRLIKRFMAQAGITGTMASPKGLRHGFAVACISKDIPLTTVQKWMGHARLETTSIYLNVSGQEERNLAKRIWD
jgi:site-specific recombinase XerD